MLKTYSSKMVTIIYPQPIVDLWEVNTTVVKSLIFQKWPEIWTFMRNKFLNVGKQYFSKHSAHQSKMSRTRSIKVSRTSPALWVHPGSWRIRPQGAFWEISWQLLQGHQSRSQRRSVGAFPSLVAATGLEPRSRSWCQRERHSCGDHAGRHSATQRQALGLGEHLPLRPRCDEHGEPLPAWSLSVLSVSRDTRPPASEVVWGSNETV